MAITLTNIPLPLIPVYNEIRFGCSSSQITQPNFQYQVVLSSGLTTIATLTLPPRMSGDCTFDLQDIISNYVENYYPYQAYGWQDCSLAYRTFTVAINEIYGTTPITYLGTTTTLKVWNGALEREERRTYSNLIFNNTAQSLNQYPSTINDYGNGDLVFYFLENTANEVSLCEIKTYNAAGTVLQDFIISNSSATTTPYVCINVGVNGLLNLMSAQCVYTTGSFPFTTNNVAFYTVYFQSTAKSQTYRVNINNCCSRGTIKKLIWLNRYGAFDSFIFCSKNTLNTDVNKQYYNGITQYYNASYIQAPSTNAIPNTPIDINKKVLFNTNTSHQVLTTNYINEQTQLMLAEAIKSSVMMLQDVNTGLYQLVNPDDVKVTYKQKVFDKLIQMQLNISDGFTNRRQNP